MSILFYDEDMQAKSLDFMQHPDQWPNWARLPMKRWRDLGDGGKTMDCGVLYFGWDFDSDYYFVEGPQNWTDPLAGFRPPEDKKRRFGEVTELEQLIKEGWVVD